MLETKTLNNSDASGARENVEDLVIWGNPDLWLLIGKASSDKQGFMKSTKAMEVPGVGCFVQVTTQQIFEVGQKNHHVVAEGVTFAVGMRIHTYLGLDNEPIQRELVAIDGEPLPDVLPEMTEEYQAHQSKTETDRIKEIEEAEALHEKNVVELNRRIEAREKELEDALAAVRTQRDEADAALAEVEELKSAATQERLAAGEHLREAQAKNTNATKVNTLAGAAVARAEARAARHIDVPEGHAEGDEEIAPDPREQVVADPPAADGADADGDTVDE